MQPREQGIYFFHKSFFYWRPSPYLGAASLPLAHSHLYSAVNDSCWLRIDLLTPPPADSLLYLHSLWSLRAHTKRLDSHWGFWAWREPASAVQVAFMWSLMSILSGCKKSVILLTIITCPVVPPNFQYYFSESILGMSESKMSAIMSLSKVYYATV